MLDVYIHKTINKLTLKRKTTKARINAKKVITRLCNVCVKLGSVKKLIVYQNSRLSTIPTFNMIKVNQYDNQGKISRTWSKICESKKIIDTCSPALKTDQNIACIALFKLRNKPQNVLNINTRHFQYGFRYTAP